jgi:hypothetical protein
MNELVRELNNSNITLTLDQSNSNGSLSRSNSGNVIEHHRRINPLDVFINCLVSTSVVPNEQIEADVQQLMDLMKTRKQQLEELLNKKMKDFSLLCALENVCLVFVRCRFALTR